MTSGDTAIETADLAKRYGGLVALAGLSMRIPHGDVFGFLGPNGAGKTTAVKLLLGLSRPTSGEARLLGASLDDARAHREARRRVGYLPELFRYQGWLTAREVLGVHADLAGLPRSEAPPEIARVLGVVGLAARAGDRVANYSKGMQQRLGLAVALLGRPALVMLDEPTSALDPVGRHDVREIIRALKAEGVTVFLNSHLLSEVEQVCDRVAIVDRGRVIAQGTFEELLAGDTVHLRVTGGVPDDLDRFGTLDREGDRLVVRGIARERIPDLVAALVAAGARVHEVRPAQESLEDRFLSLLGHDA
ncbi:MAG TPA: ABC transporter ATP-binding protein [Candidatus Limnocylindria bacterium]|nr:ABC transporter ATP-binding protein [Candidatus Limnocylindria bacterium]